MRRFLTFLAVWPLILFGGLPPGVARPSATRTPRFVAYDLAQRFQQARHLQLADRGTGTARPLILAPVSAAAFDQVTNVEQISQDTLQGPAGSQDDTQVEPDIAIDPNDDSILTATFQQGRFQDGGSVTRSSVRPIQSWPSGPMAPCTFRPSGSTSATAAVP
jgi:hypothetical protein